MNEEELKEKIIKKLLKNKKIKKELFKKEYDTFIIESVKEEIEKKSKKDESKIKKILEENKKLFKGVISEIEEKKIKTIIEEIKKIRFEVPEIEAPEIPKELIVEMKKEKIDYDKIVIPIIRELSKSKELRISKIENPLPISEIEKKTYEMLSEILNKDFPTKLQVRDKEGKVINPATEETLKILAKRIVARGSRGIDKTEMKGVLEDYPASKEDGNLADIKINTDKIISNPSTEDKQDDVIAEIQKLIGFEIPAHDYIALTYVAAGNGAGEIETVVYKSGGSGGTTEATLTLAYNGDDEISSITKT